MHRLKAEIPIILCKLEKIFPPPFYDPMLHLVVHLPDEALLRGPVQYGWMYPIERRLYTLKRFVRNMARPEGSIAEAYVAKECLTACSRYFDDVDTRHNREGRNRERVDLHQGDLSVFQYGVDLLGACTITYLEHDYDKMVWYVLNNCHEVEPFMEYVIPSILFLFYIAYYYYLLALIFELTMVCRIYRKELENQAILDVEKIVEKKFSSWFKKHVSIQSKVCFHAIFNCILV